MNDYFEQDQFKRDRLVAHNAAAMILCLVSLGCELPLRVILLVAIYWHLPERSNWLGVILAVYMAASVLDVVLRSLAEFTEEDI